MGIALIDALKYLTSQNSLSLSSSETEIHVSTTRSTIFRTEQSVGDIDVALYFNNDVVFTDLFPSYGINIRPVYAISWSQRGALVEFKRSCSPRDARKKITTFVQFYMKILHSPLRNKLLFSSTLDGHLEDLFNDTNVPIIFAFNGSDHQDAYNHFDSLVPTGRIRGHPVAIVFIKSEELLHWENNLMRDQVIQQQAQSIRQQEQELRELRQQLQELRQREQVIAERDLARDREMASV